MTLLFTGLAFLVGLVLIGFCAGYALGEQQGYRDGFADGLVDEEAA